MFNTNLFILPHIIETLRIITIAKEISENIYKFDTWTESKFCSGNYSWENMRTFPMHENKSTTTIQNLQVTVHWHVAVHSERAYLIMK